MRDGQVVLHKYETSVMRIEFWLKSHEGQVRLVDFTFLVEDQRPVEDDGVPPPLLQRAYSKGFQRMNLHTTSELLLMLFIS